jgi:hypothetical protein
MPEYAHTLIPTQVDFVPDGTRVASFLSALDSTGALPLKSTVAVSKLTGEVQTFKHPKTGEAESFAIRKLKKLKSLAAVPSAIKGIEDYNLSVMGEGPPQLPAFLFDHPGSYEFVVNCCLRAELVSTSDWHDEVPIKRKVKFFGQPCGPKDRLGIFHNPNTLEVIEVPNAGCARFWIEFEYGKMLFPQIEDRLDLIEPRLVQIAEKEFGITFTQGCHWCA